MDYDAHHCALTVADMDDSLSFYRDRLGFEVVRQWPAGELQARLDGLENRSDFDVADTAGEITYLSAGDFYLELIEYRHPPSRNATDGLGNDVIGRVHVCVTTPDFRATYETFDGSVEFVSRPVMTTSGGLMAKCYDPSGNLIEFMEPGDADAEADGGNKKGVVTGIHHYGVNTADLEAAIEFYRETFGWPLRSRYVPPQRVDEFASGLDPGDGTTELAFLDAGGCEIELLEYPEATNANPSMAEIDVGRPHLGIRVEDVEATYEELGQRLEFIGPPQTSSRGAAVVKCRAHEGYTVEFIEPPAWLA